MATWEYLELSVLGHNTHYASASNILVSTSDGGLRGRKVAKPELVLIVNQLGGQGWELVSVQSDTGTDGQTAKVSYWLKRQRG